jgi:hypothetical protein
MQPMWLAAMIVNTYIATVPSHGIYWFSELYPDRMSSLFSFLWFWLVEGGGGGGGIQLAVVIRAFLAPHFMFVGNRYWRDMSTPYTFKLQTTLLSGIQCIRRTPKGDYMLLSSE